MRPLLEVGVAPSSPLHIPHSQWGSVSVLNWIHLVSGALRRGLEDVQCGQVASLCKTRAVVNLLDEGADEGGEGAGLCSDGCAWCFQALEKKGISHLEEKELKERNKRIQEDNRLELQKVGAHQPAGQGPPSPGPGGPPPVAELERA